MHYSILLRQLIVSVFLMNQEFDPKKKVNRHFRNELTDDNLKTDRKFSPIVILFISEFWSNNPETFGFLSNIFVIEQDPCFMSWNGPWKLVANNWSIVFLSEANRMSEPLPLAGGSGSRSGEKFEFFFKKIWKNL
jgi:hypothetical protein